MKIDRKKNAVKGTVFGIIYKMTQIFFPFIIRSVFIYTLGVEYLGLNSLFSSILQVLNLAELGVGSALVFSMYRPIAEDNSEKICQLMNLYRRYYRIIGLIVLIVGVCLIPFLHILIKDTVPSDVNLYILYTLHLCSTVLSYWLFAYRNSLFAAHQRNDIISIINIVVYTILYILQAIVLFLFRNYYIYLCLQIVAQIAINLITAIASKIRFPDYRPVGKLPRDEQREINKKVRDLFTAKVGSVVNHSADSVVISAFMGLTILAMYQNYYYLIAALMAMFKIFFSACTAGIGNSLIVNSKEQNKRLLYNMNHIAFLGISVCCVCFICLCQPFMQLWVGSRYELEFPFVLLFALYLFAEEGPRTLVVFKDAGGIWRHDRFRPLITACVNLTFNLLLTPIIGLYGIIISTIMSLLFVAYPWLIININKRLFNIGVRKYVSRVIMYIVVIVIEVAISYGISNTIRINSIILTLVVRLIISVLVSITIFHITFYRTDEHKYLIKQVITVKNKLLRNRF